MFFYYSQEINFDNQENFIHLKERHEVKNLGSYLQESCKSKLFYLKVSGFSGINLQKLAQVPFIQLEYQKQNWINKSFYDLRWYKCL